MTRLEALERVAEAAAILAHSAGVIRGKTPEDDDTWTVELDHIRELNAALAAVIPLVQAAEREACAEVADTCDSPWSSATQEQDQAAAEMADRIAAAIRARNPA